MNVGNDDVLPLESPNEQLKNMLKYKNVGDLLLIPKHKNEIFSRNGPKLS